MEPDIKLIISEHETQVVYCVINHCLRDSCEVILDNVAHLICCVINHCLWVGYKVDYIRT